MSAVAGWLTAAANAFLGPTEFGTGWEPSPKQELATELAQEADETLFGGAAGGGKTEWLIEYGIREMERYPGNRGVIFRRVFPSLNRSVVPRALTKLAGRARWNANDHTFTFPNRSVLELGSLQYKNSVIDHQGAEYGWIGFEEITEFLEYQYEFMLGRLRAPADGIRPHAAATTNPGGAGHKWVKRRWVKPLENEDYEGKRPEPFEIWVPKPTLERPDPLRRVFVPATLEDNPHLLARDPGYVDRLRAISDRGLRKALESGDWDAIEAVEGALWQQPWLDSGRIQTIDGKVIARRVVAADPSDGDDSGDAFGICVACRGMDGVGYVEQSHGWRATPKEMARRAINLYHEVQADALVIEKNHGGKWLLEVFRNVDPYVNIVVVNASENKKTRAEPVASLFQPDPGFKDLPVRAKMVGYHPELEEQLTRYTGEAGQDSPDEMDAMVWALTDLMIGYGAARVGQATDQRLRGRR